MFRSSYNDEREIALRHEHIEQVWSAIAQAFPRYFDRFVEHSLQLSTPLAGAIETLSSKYKVKRSKVNAAPALQTRFQHALNKFDKDAEAFRGFFNEEVLQEYEELDAKEFKRDLRDKKNCPIIHNCVTSKRENMRDWQIKFGVRDPRELRAVFKELVLAAQDYAEEGRPDDYDAVQTWSELGLDRFDEDETLSAEGIIGTGIKSAVLYHLRPDIFPFCGRNGRYALYFMSGSDKHFGMPSLTNEFIMVNDLKHEDRIQTMEHNYWYPYKVYTLYQIRLHRLLDKACSEQGVSLLPQYRFVYNQSFLDHVVELPPESELLKAMQAPEEDLW
jgi:hypothetical protein